MYRIDTREKLVDALHAAARLEHALCCCYLSAAFSLKQRPEEGGVDWAELREVTVWKGQLLLVARQEMEHLGLVGNLLISLGAQPDFGRHRFPFTPVVPDALPALTLQPFGPETMDRFVAFERPDFLHLSQILARIVAGERWEEALRLVARRFCADADWDGAAVWTRDAQGWARCAHADYAPVGPAPEGFDAVVAATLGDRTPGHEVSRHGLPDGTGTALTLAVPAPAGAAQDDAGPMAVIAFWHADSATAQEDAGTLDCLMNALECRETPDAPSLLDILASCRAAPRPAGPPMAVASTPEVPGTIGGFYRAIRSGFRRTGPQILAGEAGREPGDKDFTLTLPGWFNMRFEQVPSVDAACKVIDQIVEEGEGTSHPAATSVDGGDAAGESHYARFVAVRAALHDRLAARPGFAPVRAVAGDPRADAATAPETAALMRVFDEVYALMVQMLALYYAGTRDPARAEAPAHSALPHGFLPIMSMAIRTLGEVLTLCPYDAEGGRRAGPAFAAGPGLGSLPADADAIGALCQALRARAADLRTLATADHGWRASDDPETVARRIATASANLARIAENLAMRAQPEPAS